MSDDAQKPAQTDQPADDLARAQAELAGKPVNVEPAAGTANPLVARLRVKSFFNSIYLGLVLGSIVASLISVILSKTELAGRLKLIPSSVIIMVRQLPTAAAGLAGRPLSLIVAGAAAAWVAFCWIKSREWIAALIVTRTVLLVFWILVAYWLLSVIGMGEPVPRWPRF